MAEIDPSGGVVDETPVIKPVELDNESTELLSNESHVDENTMDCAKANEAVYEPTSMSGSRSASPIFEVDSGFYKMLLNPLMEKLEETSIKNYEILDDIMSKMKEEREQMMKKQLNTHVPHILQGKGRDLLETVQQLENFIEFENYDPETTDSSKLIKSNLRLLDRSAEIAIISHSLAAFMSTLDSQHLKHLATKVVTDVSSWIAKIFQFSEAAVYFHEEEKEGLAKVCQLALHQKYPKYATDGYEVLYTRPPVIYVSSAAKPNLGQYLCHQLGLPLSCLCIVPCEISQMDLFALQKLVEDDANSGKTPVIVIAQAGAMLTGQTDNLQRIHEICRLRDLWLHVEGCGLSMLASPSVPSHLAAATLANSATFHIGSWLGLPAVPFVVSLETLFRSPDIGLSRLVGLSTFNVRYKLNCLSLWMCLLHLGQDNVVSRLMYYMGLAKIVHERVLQIYTSNELVVLDLQSPVVIIRYQAKNDHCTHITMQERDQELSYQDDEKSLDKKNSYFDTLNIWLVEALKREVPDFHISAVEIPTIGLCIRYSPLDVTDMFEMSHQLINGFLQCFERHVHILDATVAVKRYFADIVENQDNLRLIHLPTWAGLGAVQYISESWRDKLDSLPDIGKNEINVLNQEMVNRLKFTDTAFSLGVSPEGLYCIRFGLVTSDTDLEELIGTVVATGKDVEDSSKYLESMAEVIRLGIEKAEADLEKENQEKLQQTGVLRQVPLVGSLLNWWSPSPKDPIKGRCFNLTSGKVASTETTYKYHMQIQENSLELGNKSRDVPHKSLLKPAKSKLPHSNALQMNVDSIVNVDSDQSSPAISMNATSENLMSVPPIESVESVDIK